MRKAGMLVMLFAVGTCLAEQKTLTGYLVDKACSADYVKKGYAAAKGHDVGCAQMDDCAKTGYGVLTADNEFVAFDAGGNKRAAAALKGTAKKTDLQVTVSGEVSGDSMKVAALKMN